MSENIYLSKSLALRAILFSNERSRHSLIYCQELSQLISGTDTCSKSIPVGAGLPRAITLKTITPKADQVPSNMFYNCLTFSISWLAKREIQFSKTDRASSVSNWITRHLIHLSAHGYDLWFIDFWQLYQLHTTNASWYTQFCQNLGFIPRLAAPWDNFRIGHYPLGPRLNFRHTIRSISVWASSIGADDGLTSTANVYHSAVIVACLAYW